MKLDKDVKVPKFDRSQEPPPDPFSAAGPAILLVLIAFLIAWLLC